VRTSEDEQQAATVGDTSASARLYRLGREAYVRAEYDSARLLLESARAGAEETGDSATVARALTLTGLTWYRQGGYDSARAIGERALDLKLRLAIADELSSSYNMLGLIAWNESRLTEAEELFLKTAEAAVAENEDRARAVVGINRGLVLTDLGRFADAKTSFQEALATAREIEEPRLEGMALTNLGMLAVWTGAPLDAITYLEAAVPPYREAEEVFGEVNALGQLGTAYAALGRMGEAIVVLDSAVRLAQDRDMRQEEAANLEVLAEAYRTVGDCERALDLYAQAEAINAEVGLASEMGSDQRARAEIYRQLGSLEMAREFAERALATHQAAGAQWEAFADHILLADLFDQMGMAEAATTHLGEARRIAEQCDARTARVDLALAEAGLADRAAQPRRVLQVLERSRMDLAVGGYDSEWKSETLRARALAALRHLDSAAAAGRRAVAAVERVRSSFGSGALRSRYATFRVDAYATLVEILLARGDTMTAFEVADAARGRMLLEQLGATRQPSSEKTALAALEEREAVLREIDGLQAKVREMEAFDPHNPDSAAISELDARLAAARRRFERLEVQAAEQYPPDVTLLGKGATSAAAVQRSMRPNEALLEYLVTDDRVLGFAMTRESIRNFEAPISREELAARVRLARGLLADLSGDGTHARAVLSGLHDLLIAPAEIGEAGRLVVVPHDALSYLPFAALVDAATDRYLVEDHDVQMLPAAAALPVLRDRASGELRNARVQAFAPFVADLPATRTEVMAIRDVTAEAIVVEGRRATEGRVRDALQEQAIVHIASHGVMNARSPLFSRLELSRRDSRTDDDGRLEVHEVLQLPIRSPLVFLSGCETGVGTAWSTSFTRGEDYATLARSFLYAGAQYVVATLWRIEDEGAAAFAEQFYSLLRTSGPVEALAGAQRALQLDARYSSPYHWAGYRLNGAGAQTEGYVSVQR
jgi:CHAT domain-containing protein